MSNYKEKDIKPGQMWHVTNTVIIISPNFGNMYKYENPTNWHVGEIEGEDKIKRYLIRNQARLIVDLTDVASEVMRDE